MIRNGFNGNVRGGSSFTLVELLVVICIIALLASLSLSGLSQSRARARQAACMNQLRQIGLAGTMYYTDRKSYPLAYRFLDDFSLFYPYLNNLKVFHCPGNPNSRNLNLTYNDLNGKTDYLYWPGSLGLADVENNGNHNNGNGNNNNPYKFDPSNPKVIRVMADKLKMPVIYDFCGPAHFRTINIVYLQDIHVDVKPDMCDLWVLDKNGKLVIDSNTPFPSL